MAAPAFSVPDPNTARLADPTLRETLLRYARRRLPPAEVDDLVQNTLTDALIAGNAPSDPGDFQRWVHGIARHKIADLYRRRGRLPVLDGDLDARFSDPGPATGELAQWIERELPKTDGAQATLHWLLREGDGESLDEIARDAALPAPRVRQRVSRLRRHLHSRWLALGAAGLALLLAATALLHAIRKTEVPAPAIARDIAPSAAPPSVTPIPAISAPAMGTPALAAPPAKLAPKSKLAPKPKALPRSKPNPKLQLAPKSNTNTNALPMNIGSMKKSQSKSNFDDLQLPEQN
ncbi:MAG TPA: sigma-70 family RNA polymerase sigma factor [Polyangiaceae bacterium]|jgi:RNA polymerase sigma-70 factor (ECF subfamily)